MITNIALDYTAYAPPLTADAILRDIQGFIGAHVDSPDKIIVWIHQWDYLVKKDINLRPEPGWIFDKVEFNDRGDLCAIGRKLPHTVVEEKGELWGVPVEVREP